MEWHWVLCDEHGREMTAPGVMSIDQRFPSQSDAETWVGEMWPDLRDAGVSSVTLRESDRVVYGPMSLHPSR